MFLFLKGRKMERLELVFGVIKWKKNKKWMNVALTLFPYVSLSYWRENETTRCCICCYKVKEKQEVNERCAFSFFLMFLFLIEWKRGTTICRICCYKVKKNEKRIAFTLSLSPYVSLSNGMKKEWLDLVFCVIKCKKNKKRKTKHLSLFVFLCGWRDSNPHASRRQILSLVRLPISPHPLKERYSSFKRKANV